MKKIILQYSIIFLLFSSICFSQKNNTKFELGENDKLNIDLNGKVKTIKIKTHDLQSKLSDSLVYMFEENGNINKLIVFDLGFDAIERKLKIEEVYYGFINGKLMSKLNKLNNGLDGDTYTYDKNWNLIVLKNYMSNILVKEAIYQYDDKNRKIEATEYLYGGFSDYNEKTQQNKSKYLNEIEKFEYNSNDLIILKRTYAFRENKTMEKSSYKYNTAGKLVEEGHCVSYGSEDCDCKPLYGFDYNFIGQLTKSYQLAKFSPHNTESYYTYDNYGNEIEVKGFYIYPDKEPILGYDYKSEYDTFKNRTKEEELTGTYRTLPGFQKYKTQLTHYDEFQNIVLDEYVTSDSTTIKAVRNTYTYDKKHNWINMKTEEGENLDELKLIKVSERDITYY